jgi:hypothetical protein
MEDDTVEVGGGSDRITGYLRHLRECRWCSVASVLGDATMLGVARPGRPHRSIKNCRLGIPTVRDRVCRWPRSWWSSRSLRQISGNAPGGFARSAVRPMRSRSSEDNEPWVQLRRRRGHRELLRRIRQEKLLTLVERRISDRRVLRLIRPVAGGRGVRGRYGARGSLYKSAESARVRLPCESLRQKSRGWVVSRVSRARS